MRNMEYLKDSYQVHRKRSKRKAIRIFVSSANIM